LSLISFSIQLPSLLALTKRISDTPKSKDFTLGGSLKIKMRDPGIQSSIFNLENDGSIDFLINRETAVQELWLFHVGIFT